MNYQGVVWQETFLECHYTNAAPQHSLLNQGKQLWQGLENYILNSAHKEKSVRTSLEPLFRSRIPRT
jgi:DNA/RNA endonuclease G (NUC1)